MKHEAPDEPEGAPRLALRKIDPGKESALHYLAPGHRTVLSNPAVTIARLTQAVPDRSLRRSGSALARKALASFSRRPFGALRLRCVANPNLPPLAVT
jgi:hypothetical protein